MTSAPFVRLVARDDAAEVEDPRVVCVPLRSLLIVR
jgi:hypothetical protein